MIDPGKGKWRVGQTAEVYRRGKNGRVTSQRKVVRVTKTMVIVEGSADRYRHDGSVVGSPLAEYRIRPMKRLTPAAAKAKENADELKAALTQRDAEWVAALRGIDPRVTAEYAVPEVLSEMGLDEKQLPEGWTMVEGKNGWCEVQDERGAPVCEGETEQQAFTAAWEVANDA